jgi:copper chaperone
LHKEIKNGVKDIKKDWSPDCYIGFCIKLLHLLIMQLEKASINVSGMTCSHCEKSVSEILSSIEGVEQINVNKDSSMAQFTYDSHKTTVQEIIKKINDSGIYKAN